jgi:hypothetical protein
VVPNVLGSSSFLASLERHLDHLAPWSVYGAFLGHPVTILGFGELGCVLLGDDGLVQDSVDLSNPRGIGQAHCSSSYDCCFLSTIVFLHRLMTLGSFFKLVF